MDFKNQTVKKHFKLYKAGKLWLVAVVATIGIASGSLSVNADAQGQESTTASVVEKTADNSDTSGKQNLTTNNEVPTSTPVDQKSLNNVQPKTDQVNNNDELSASGADVEEPSLASSGASNATSGAVSAQSGDGVTSSGSQSNAGKTSEAASVSAESTGAQTSTGSVAKQSDNSVVAQGSNKNDLVNGRDDSQQVVSPKVAGQQETSSVSHGETSAGSLADSVASVSSSNVQTTASLDSAAPTTNINEKNDSVKQERTAQVPNDEGEYKYIYTSPTSRYRIAAQYYTPRNVWDGSHTRFFDGNGNFVSGLQNIDNTWYYFDGNSHATVNGYVQLGWGGYLFGGNDHRIQSGFQNVSGSWYYFDDGNYQKVNYGYINGRLFAGSDGRAVSGLQYAYNNWYYFDSNSLLRTSGYVQQSWGGYMFGNNGTIQSGLVNAYGSWYYFNPGNFLRTSGYVQLPWGGYMFSDGGTAETGLVNAYGTWYYFNSSNLLRTSGYVALPWGGYMFGNGGAIQSGLVNAYGSNWYFDPVSYLKRSSSVINFNNQLVYLAGDGRVVDNGIDWSNNYGYYAGQCTAYVAKRLAQHGVAPYWFGNGADWIYHAAGVTYNAPAVGMVAWTNAGGYGHVAYVEAVYGNVVKVSEANFNGLPYHERWVRVGDGSFNAFLTFI